MAFNQVFNKNNNDSSDVWDDTALIKMYEDSIKPSVHNKYWKVGDKCQAQYPDDGLWYIGTISNITGSTAYIVFEGYESEPEIEVELDDLVEYFHQAQEERDDSNTENSENRSAAAELSIDNTSKMFEEAMKGTFGASGSNFLPPFAPPPPPVFKNISKPDEIEALSSMLMSWYMSGYHTGCYVTMQQMRRHSQEDNAVKK